MPSLRAECSVGTICTILQVSQQARRLSGMPAGFSHKDQSLSAQLLVLATLTHACWTWSYKHITYFPIPCKLPHMTSWPQNDSWVKTYSLRGETWPGWCCNLLTCGAQLWARQPRLCWENDTTSPPASSQGNQDVVWEIPRVQNCSSPSFQKEQRGTHQLLRKGTYLYFPIAQHRNN